MIEAHLRKLRHRDDVSAEEEQVVRGLVADVREVGANRVAVHGGDELSVSLLLLDGFVGRFADLKRGERQISQLHVSGDFVDLHGFTLKRLDHGLIALTAARFGIVPHDRLKALTEQHPHLTRLFWLMTNIDAAISREWELSLGRRDALARVAHLFCETFVRLEAVGLAEGRTCPFPLTQAQIAECVGLTSIHVNRMVQELRRQGLIQLRDRVLVIEDHDRLAALAEFDPTYLYLEKRPR